jgi:hypothetical protein
MAHARSGRADHLCESFLTNLPNDRFNRSFFAEIRQKQKGPRQPFLAGIEQLIDEVSGSSRLREITYALNSAGCNNPNHHQVEALGEAYRGLL